MYTGNNIIHNIRGGNYMENEKEIKLLNEIYQSAKTAVEAADVMINNTASTNFKNVLENQKKYYYEIADEAAGQLHSYKVLPSDGSIMDKLNMWSSVQMGIFADKSADNMAEIMILGSTAGMVDMTRLVNNSPEIKPEIKHLADRLISAEQANIEIMRNYL